MPDAYKLANGLPMVGKKSNVIIGTKSGQNVKNVIDRYLLGDASPSRIPPEFVKQARYDNGILKGIELTDGSKVSIYTYDQGREIWQGANPDFIWLDEEPTDPEIWNEALARTRVKGKDGESCPLLMSMTPLSGPGTPVMEFFNEQTDEDVLRQSAKWLVSFLSNPFVDTSLAKAFKGHEYRQRVLGEACAPTGLVYSEFRRGTNVVPKFDPKELGPGTKYYSGIDFGLTHPTAIVTLAVDEDDNHYVFDEWEESDATIERIAEAHKRMTAKYDFEYHVRDSAAAREGLELKSRFGIHLVPADKASKGESGESNRRAGILIINQLLADGKLVVADSCKKLIRQFETHYYKDTEKDGAVVKENDDLVDGCRYLIFMVKKNKNVGGKKERAFKDEFRASWKKVAKGDNCTVPSPY